MKNEIQVKVKDITEKNAPTIFCENGLDAFISEAKRSVEGLVFDVSTAKGRKEIASASFNVSKSKTAVEKPGREYLRKIKAQPKIIEKEIASFVKQMDQLRDETRAPLDAWEKEQERLEAEKKAQIAAEEFKRQYETDHEIGLLLNEKFDNDKKAEDEEAERQRIAYEQKLKDDAAREAEQEKINAIAREAAQKERAERAEQEAKDAAEAAENARLDQIAKQEAQALAEKKAKEKREQDIAHISKIRTGIKLKLMSIGITEEQAKRIILDASKGLIENLTINY